MESSSVAIVVLPFRRRDEDVAELVREGPRVVDLVPGLGDEQGRPTFDDLVFSTHDACRPTIVN